MDFLSIRKKARERAAAQGAAAERDERPARAERPPSAEGGPPPAAPPPAAPPKERRRRRGDEPVLTEADVAEGALQARIEELAPAQDGRFSTWRPGSGPPPVEPDPLVFAGASAAPPKPPPVEPREPPPPRPAPPRAAVAADPLDAFFYRPDEGTAAVPLLDGGADEEAAPVAPETLEEYLTFKAGAEEFAIPIAHAREVIRAPGITEVPRAPRHVIGVVSVRGEVVAVVDALSRLGLGKGSGLGGRIVIVDAGDGPLGLLVDEVASVVRLPPGSIEPCPQGIQAAASDCVTGIGRHRDRLFMVIDVGLLLGRERPAEER